MSTELAAIAKPRRRRFRYSLRTMLVMVLVLAIALAWLAERRRIAVRREILRMAGLRIETGALQPKWHVWLFGDDSPAYATSIVATLTVDADMPILRGLTRLESLNLLPSRITDAGLSHLSSQRRLRTLMLHGEKISDAGLVHLKDCRNWKSCGV